MKIRRMCRTRQRENIGCTVDYAAGRNRYLGYLMSLALCSFRNMRVGPDCANGSAWMIAKNVFRCTWRKDICDQ